MPQQSLLHSPAKVKSVNPLAEKKWEKIKLKENVKVSPFVCVNWLGNFFDYQSVNTQKCASFSSHHSASSIFYLLPATCCLTSLSALSTDSRLLPRCSCSWRHLMPLTAKSCHHKKVSQKNWRHCKMRVRNFKSYPFSEEPVIPSSLL